MRVQKKPQKWNFSMAGVQKLFSATDEEKILQAIKDAELNTSGEIRLHLENKCKGEVLDRAAEVFGKLEMHKTEARNGVLIYLAVQDHKFAILGDEGIDRVISEHFWESTRDIMMEHFRKSEFTEGLVNGINEAGIQLKAHFPYQSNDVNELSDDISKGDI